MPTPQEWVAAATAEPTPQVEPTSAPPVAESGGYRETPEQPAASGAVAGAAAEPTAQQVAELEAWLDANGTQKLKLPLTALIPRKVNGVEDRIPLEQALKEHQFEAAWTQNNQRFAKQRETFEAARREVEKSQREIELDRAAIKAEREALQAELDTFKASLGDPEAIARLVADQERLRTDPHYRKLHDDAIAHRIGAATRTRDAELASFEESQVIANEAADYITQSAAQYPGVDPDVIRQQFAEGLQTGRLPLHARTVDQLYQQEAARLKAIEDRVANPYREQLEAMKARLDALEAERKNGKVVAGLRSITPSGGPPAPSAPGVKTKLGDLPGEDLATRSQRWAQAR